METPSSTARVTRSRASAAVNNNLSVSKESRQRNTKKQQQQQDRCALIDITNDSPIVGLASGSLGTPLSSITKRRSSGAKLTPGSGEALLRGQVKTLLQKVEEECEIPKFLIKGRPFLNLKGGFTNSPCGILAPTPANTPQLSDLSGSESFKNNSVMFSPYAIVVDDQSKIQQDEETEKSQLTRSLLLDFSEKLEPSDLSDCSSVVTSNDADSGWSIQVNASSKDEDEEEVVGGEEEYEEDDDGGLVEEICEGITKMTVNEIQTEFSGKHTRFVYDSDDEIVGAEEVRKRCENAGKPTVLRLKGLPTPKGKHVRFPADEEEDEGGN